MRSILTALGIIIGVGAVVAMVAVGNGAQAKIESQVAALGQNLLIVFAGNRKSGGVNSGLGTASSLTLEDAAAIAREIPDVVAVSPEISTTAQVIANGRNWSTSILGESPELSSNPGLGAFARRDVLRSRCAQRFQGGRHRGQDRQPAFRPDQSRRPNGARENIPFVIIGLLTSKGAGHGRQRPG
jgi:putative ABC transport system permease protein